MYRDPWQIYSIHGLVIAFGPVVDKTTIADNTTHTGQKSVSGGKIQDLVLNVLGQRKPSTGGAFTFLGISQAV